MPPIEWPTRTSWPSGAASSMTAVQVAAELVDVAGLLAAAPRAPVPALVPGDHAVAVADQRLALQDPALEAEAEAVGEDDGRLVGRGGVGGRLVDLDVQRHAVVRDDDELLVGRVGVGAGGRQDGQPGVALLADPARRDAGRGGDAGGGQPDPETGEAAVRGAHCVASEVDPRHPGADPRHDLVVDGVDRRRPVLRGGLARRADAEQDDLVAGPGRAVRARGRGRTGPCRPVPPRHTCGRPPAPVRRWWRAAARRRCSPSAPGRAWCRSAGGVDVAVRDALSRRGVLDAGQPGDEPHRLAQAEVLGRPEVGDRARGRRRTGPGARGRSGPRGWSAWPRSWRGGAPAGAIAGALGLGDDALEPLLLGAHRRVLRARRRRRSG